MTAVILVLVMLFMPSILFANGQGDLSKIFPLEATISAENAGLNRVDLPIEVLSECRADLSDLRIFDLQGQELPFFIESFDSDETLVEVLQSHQAKILDVKRHESRSSSGPSRYVERYELEYPVLPIQASAWELVLRSGEREFVNLISITGRHADGSLEKILEDASTFRSISPLAERLRFVITNAGYSSIIVELEGENRRYLRPDLTFEARRFISKLSQRLVDLEVVSIEDIAGSTTFLVKRPRGLVPDSLRLTTMTSAFKRKVVVWDDGPGRVSASLGAATLFRIDAIAPIEAIEMALMPPRGDHLRIVVENRDSPPLAKVKIDALVTRPFLFFSMAEGESSVTLRFGGARARRPDYDLEALKPLHRSVISGETAEKALSFWDPTRAHHATISKVSKNVAFDPQPALSFVMHPGAELDPGPFSHRRIIEVHPSREGLSRLQIGPEDLAIARPDLGDLRIIDQEQRQWAYLLERSTGVQRISLNLKRHNIKRGESRYEIELPYAPLEIRQIDFSPEAPFYDRAFRLEGKTESGERLQLASGRLKRHQGDPRPASFSCNSMRVLSLELIIEDGDDAPL